MSKVHLSYSLATDVSCFLLSVCNLFMVILIMSLIPFSFKNLSFLFSTMYNVSFRLNGYKIGVFFLDLLFWVISNQERFNLVFELHWGKFEDYSKKGVRGVKCVNEFSRCSHPETGFSISHNSSTLINTHQLRVRVTTIIRTGETRQLTEHLIVSHRWTWGIKVGSSFFFSKVFTMTNWCTIPWMTHRSELVYLSKLLR